MPFPFAAGINIEIVGRRQNFGQRRPALHHRRHAALAAAAAGLAACTTVLLPPNITPVVAPSASVAEATARLDAIRAQLGITTASSSEPAALSEPAAVSEPEPAPEPGAAG